jgi:hypothetical protein
MESRRLKCHAYGEQQQSEYHHQERVSEDMHVRSDQAGLPQTRGLQRIEQVSTQKCEEIAKTAPEERKQKSFYDELAEQAPARCAQCHPYGNLPLPRFRARKQEVENIGAGSEENERDGGQQDQ